MSRSSVTTRRAALLAGVALPAAWAMAADPVATPWRAGLEGQRRADLGDGRYLNPVLAGDHPDPSVLRVGEQYYLVCSSFSASPGLPIWCSHDLVNWAPLGAALRQSLGSVWAPELCQHGGRFHIYFTVKRPPHNTCYVISADHPTGPWSEPVDLKLPRHIDPGHAVDEAGARWLFLSGGDRVRLAADGLSTAGAVEHAYDPWRYPADWEVEAFSPEGPKITRRGDWFYLLTAVGGTAGPPQHPRNPLVRSASAREAWWSRGHATLVEGPRGDWWALYHGYENGYRTLGRQALLAPVRWGDDGWFDIGGGDLSQPLAAPLPSTLPATHGLPLSDDFRSDGLGLRWHFADTRAETRGGDALRLRRDGDGLWLAASGQSPQDSPPLALTVGDHGYEIECDIELEGAARAGLLLYYDPRLYAGLGFDERAFVVHQYGTERGRPAHPHGRRLKLRLRNDHHVLSLHVAAPGQAWQRFDRGMEVSAYHHEVRGGFASLRPALYAAGEGAARFRDFRYRAL
ncbi:MAG: family 43 glycosylhydrolase [Burkholderiales bacterium]|nr:family 43 glycosylhydrolase [Burkholderiales bacterium]